MKAERIPKNESTFYNIKDFYVDFNIGYASILLEDLFNGDKDLGELNFKNPSVFYRPINHFVQFYGT